MGEGRGGGTPGLLRKRPSVFPSLLSPPPQCGVASEQSQGDSVRQMCVGKRKRKKSVGGEKV